MIRFLLAALLLVAVPAAAQTDAAAFLTANRTKAGVVETPSGLQYRVLAGGDGAGSPTEADVALVNYDGALINGVQFDKSTQPVPMPVAGVIPGFTEALKLMSRGARYRVWIKPELGYGAEAMRDGAGVETIPANSVLVFEIELLDFIPEATLRELMRQQQSTSPSGR